MTTVQPDSKNVKEAIKWISENLKEDETRNPTGLIEEAGARFNLSPKDQEFLINFYNKM